METKPLLFGLIAFFIGGLIVSASGAYLEKPGEDHHDTGMSMMQMTQALENKTGDDFDKEFITQMIEHHEGAVDMAKLSADRAKHDEIKKLSTDIIAAQEKEISDMKKWQQDWGYGPSNPQHGMH